MDFVLETGKLDTQNRKANAFFEISLVLWHSLSVITNLFFFNCLLAMTRLCCADIKLVTFHCNIEGSQDFLGDLSFPEIY